MPALILIPSLCYQGQGKRDAKNPPRRSSPLSRMKKSLLSNRNEAPCQPEVRTGFSPWPERSGQPGQEPPRTTRGLRKPVTSGASVSPPAARAPRPPPPTALLREAEQQAPDPTPDHSWPRRARRSLQEEPPPGFSSVPVGPQDCEVNQPGGVARPGLCVDTARNSSERGVKQTQSNRKTGPPREGRRPLWLQAACLSPGPHLPSGHQTTLSPHAASAGACAPGAPALETPAPPSSTQHPSASPTLPTPPQLLLQLRKKESPPRLTLGGRSRPCHHQTCWGAF